MIPSGEASHLPPIQNAGSSKNMIVLGKRPSYTFSLLATMPPESKKSLNDLWRMASNLQKGRKDAVNSWNSLPKQKTKWSDEKYQARANIIGLPKGRIPPLAHELSRVGPFNSPAITAARRRCHASKTTCYKQRRIDDARGSKDLAGLGQRVQQQTRGLNQWKPGLEKQKVTWPTNSNVYQKKWISTAALVPKTIMSTG